MISPAAERKRRLEASYEAGAAERRNRPSGLVALTLVLLLLASIYAIYASSQLASARNGLRGAERSMQALVDLRGQIENYQDSESQRQLRVAYAPRMRNIRSRLEKLARDVGMGDALPQLGQISDQRKLGLDSPLLLRTIDATILEGNTDNALEWIQAATEDVDGLFVNGITLNPSADGRRMTIKLSRWEIE